MGVPTIGMMFLFWGPDLGFPSFSETIITRVALFAHSLFSCIHPSMRGESIGLHTISKCPKGQAHKLHEYSWKARQGLYVLSDTLHWRHTGFGNKLKVEVSQNTGGQCYTSPHHTSLPIRGHDGSDPVTRCHDEEHPPQSFVTVSTHHLM